MKDIKKQRKISFSRIFVAILMLGLVLPTVNFRSVRAESSEFFNVDGYDITILEGVGRDEDMVYATLGATQNMRIYDLEAQVEVPESDDSELELIRLSKYSGIWNYISANSYTGLVEWDSDDYYEIEAGEGIFSADYYVKESVSNMDRQVPVKIISAVISVDDGATLETIENLTLNADVTVTTRNDYYSVDVDIWGDGWVDYPDYVLSDETLRIECEPDDGYELLYVLLNYSDVTDRFKDGEEEFAVADDNFYFQFFFQPVYEVVEGDGGEYIKGSGEELGFTIEEDADLTNFEGIGVVQVDEIYPYAGSEWTVDEGTNTITLSSDFLDSLEAGEHSLELIFPDPEKGVARATFYVIDNSEPGEEEEEENSDEDVVSVPDTGDNSANHDGASTFGSAVTISMFVGIITATVVWRTLRKY